MKYISTRNTSLRKSFSEVLLGGLAPDEGLYMPLEIPKFSIDQLDNFEELTYQQLTTEILYQFVSEEIDKKDFKNIVNNSYQVFDTEEVVNLVELEEQRWVLELFHGPTLAFKDIAMQLLGTLLEHFSQKHEKKNCCFRSHLW